MGICHMPIFLASKVKQRDNELWTTIYPECASETVCKHQFPEAWFEFRAANPWRNMAQQKKTLSPSLSLCQTFYLIHSVDQHSISTLAWFNHWCQSDLAKAVKVCTNDANCNLQPGWSTSCQSHFQACVIFFANANHDQLDGALSLLAFHLCGERLTTHAWGSIESPWIKEPTYCKRL